MGACAKPPKLEFPPDTQMSSDPVKLLYITFTHLHKIKISFEKHSRSAQGYATAAPNTSNVTTHTHTHPSTQTPTHTHTHTQQCNEREERKKTIIAEAAAPFDRLLVQVLSH